MKCPECNKERLLLAPLMTSIEKTKWMCAICALEKVNKQHGLPVGTPFEGTMAKEMYDKEIEAEKGG